MIFFSNSALIITGLVNLAQTPAMLFKNLHSDSAFGKQSLILVGLYKLGSNVTYLIQM